MTFDPDRLRRCADTMRRFKAATIDAHELDAAADEIARLRYVLAGVRGAIQTGQNEPLMIWKDQIDIALSSESKEGQSDGE